MKNMYGYNLVPIYTQEQIKDRVKELGVEISNKFRDEIPIFIGVLNGSFIFLADLLRELTIDCEIDFIKLSSYDKPLSTGTVHLLKDISADIKSQAWFDSDFAEKLIDFLGEIAKADGVVLDSEKFTLVDLANLWKVKPHL